MEACSGPSGTETDMLRCTKEGHVGREELGSFDKLWGPENGNLGGRYLGLWGGFYRLSGTWRGQIWGRLG